MECVFPMVFIQTQIMTLIAQMLRPSPVVLQVHLSTRSEILQTPNLVVWNMFFHILRIIASDELIFFKKGGSTTNQQCLVLQYVIPEVCTCHG